MSRADEIEALAVEYELEYNSTQVVEALREYAALLRDTRPRFAGGARAQEDEDRCAPLVEALEAIRDYPYAMDFFVRDVATLALRAHREREGA